MTDHIIIGTPGKVLDWGLKFRFFDLKKIRVFVLDEADVMIATEGEVKVCWSHVGKICQRLLPHTWDN